MIRAGPAAGGGGGKDPPQGGTPQGSTYYRHLDLLVCGDDETTSAHAVRTVRKPSGFPTSTCYVRTVRVPFAVFCVVPSVCSHLRPHHGVMVLTSCLLFYC